MKNHVLAAVAALAIGGSARAGVPLLPPGGARLDDLVHAQCFLEPKLTVRQAINLLVGKAMRGERLPDIPNEGA